MAIERGKSFSIAVISCSISRSARSEVSTNCVCPSRHEMHSQYEPCSFEPRMFCVSRSNCFKSVTLIFSSPYYYNEPEINQPQLQQQGLLKSRALVTPREGWKGDRKGPHHPTPLPPP